MQDQNTPKTTEEQAPRAWVTPIFVQVELKDALSGTGPYIATDFDTYQS